MTARMQHIEIKDWKHRMEQRDRERERRARRAAFWRPIRQGFLQAFRDFWALASNPWVWVAAAFATWIVLRGGQ